MSSHLQFAPTSVRATSRAAKRTNTFDYSTDEDHDDTPKTIISFYEYQRTRGQPSSDKLAATIRWPLPLAFTEPNALTFESYNLAMLGNDSNRIGQALVDKVKNGIDLLGEGDYGIGGNASAALQLGLNTFAVSPISRDTGIGRYLQVQQGIVANPHTTVLFNGVPLRRFSLNWRFSPRRKSQADQLLEQIFQIKRNIYPEETDSGFALQYPNLAVVNFTNTRLPSIRKSFIESFIINNSSGSSMEFYRDGTPIDFDITISFFETEIITRDTLDGITRGDYSVAESVLSAFGFGGGQTSQPTSGVR